jgi:SAM-dependent methyltransferase
MTIVCPLSGSKNVELIEQIKIHELVEIYKRSLKQDISSEIEPSLKHINFYRSTESDLLFFEPAITGSEKFYEHLQRFDWYYLDEKSEYDYAKNFIQASDLVLEIGCGKGAFAKKIASKSYVGLEFSKAAQDIAAQTGITVINETIQTHRQRNSEKYDVVCAFQVLEHVAEVHSFIEASVACLKPGGLLIYSVPSADSLVRHIINFSLDLPPHHVTRWTDQALQNIANYFPLQLVDLWHEPLQAIHSRYYAEIICKNALFKLANKKSKNVDLSPGTLFLVKLGRKLGKYLVKGIVDPELLPRGFSVTVVYRKNA